MVGMAIDKIGSQAFAPSDILHQVQTSERSTMTYNAKEKTNEKLDGFGMLKTESVEEAVDKLNNFLEPVRRNLKFELHDKLDKYYVTVVDSNTDEVSKEMPPKKILDMYAATAEFMGLLVDRKV